MSKVADLRAIGQRMRTIRMMLHKTQKEMSSDLGISLSHYSKLEVGLGGVGRQLLDSFCAQYKLDRNWLYFGLGEAPKSVHQPLGEIRIELTEDRILRIIEIARNQKLMQPFRDMENAINMKGTAANRNANLAKMILSAMETEEKNRLEELQREDEQKREAIAQRRAIMRAQRAERLKNPNAPRRGRGRPRKNPEI